MAAGIPVDPQIEQIEPEFEEQLELPAGADVVTVYFVQPRSMFRYLRSTVLERAPGPIFALNWGLGGINEGKAVLPDSYTVDRDPEIFARFWDPWIRGAPVKGIEAWSRMTRAEREVIAMDLLFYGFPSELLLDVPRPGRRPVQERPTVSFARARDMLAAGLAYHRNRAIFPFLIKTANDYFFTVAVLTHSEERVDLGLTRRKSSNHRDIEEEKFWESLLSINPDGVTQFGSCVFRHHVYVAGRDLDTWAQDKCAIPSIGYEPHIRKQNIWTCSPSLCVELVARPKANSPSQANLEVNVYYVDQETLADPRDAEIIRLLGHDDEVMFLSVSG